MHFVIIVNEFCHYYVVITLFFSLDVLGSVSNNSTNLVTYLL